MVINSVLQKEKTTTLPPKDDNFTTKAYLKTTTLPPKDDNFTTERSFSVKSKRRQLYHHQQAAQFCIRRQLYHE